MGIPPATVENAYRGLPKEQKDNIIISPAPRNMHPQRNVQRRKARAVALLRRATELPGGCCFVDAAQYGNSNNFAVVSINHRGSTVNAASVRSTSSHAAEQVAIALALLDDGHANVFSDSRAAICAFSVGAVCKEACRILDGKSIATHTLTWFPAHMGSIMGGPTNLNELAHSKARGLAFRDHGELQRRPAVVENRDQPTTYNEIAQHFYLGRRDFPVPHKKLNRAQALTLRLLQTGSYPNPALFHKIYPDTYATSSCRHCNDIASLDHMLWRCPSLRGTEQINEDKWRSAIKSPDAGAQLWAVQRAHDAAVGQGLTVPTWERPAAR
ncbi:uncharacterized protein [Dermacentor andersoni]|uniref:uncharacterized protein n=1 Tax=Dermacentor andersoni TaxID=34620 RepID=UPI0024172DA3|nr:uncharacterized protein LOC129384481 [Dermacentor andersoni]XP_054925945.1 uncharacterized protein LOC129384481 [Dermacentor andersoni]XP_054925946.1 uncharacterized protein LOC129384481 [Dermacentor andersoni]XP_054925947.1 uncharacterized protein LOC129384481 [Dermacentor andersoni]XP_054925948.1 uncharacterized protein LOC129384481 [Dermacentor andersoni]XP_054925949.1 uncharacterized protein LOC129384481 [Dermacentor andersoni]